VVAPINLNWTNPIKIIAASPDSILAVVPKMAGSGSVKVTVATDTLKGPWIVYNYVVTDFNVHLAKVHPDNSFTLIYNDSMPNAGIAGNLYVSVYGIFKITPTGVKTLAFFDNQFQGWEIARDTLGNIYEADHFNNNVRMIEASTGNVFTIAGSGNAQDIDGIGLNASFNGPQGLCIDDNGALYMTTFNYTNNGGNKIRKIVIQ
jgi:hypothetical protein